MLLVWSSLPVQGSLGLFNTTQPLDLLEHIGEGIFALDPEWRFAYLNRQAERVITRLSGHPSTDLLGTVIWDRPALADSTLGRALHRAYTDQTPVVQEWLVLQVWVAWPHVPQQSGLTHVRVVPGTHWHPLHALFEHVFAKPALQPDVVVAPSRQ